MNKRTAPPLLLSLFILACADTGLDSQVSLESAQAANRPAAPGAE